MKNSRKNNVFRLLAVLCFACAAPLTGKETEKDPLREAAMDDDAVSQLKLGYEFFFGTEKRIANMRLAVYWFRRAADSGSHEAQYNLGMCYLRGWGVPVSARMAYVWLEKAAASIPDAETRLAVLEYTGVPAEENESGRFAELPPAPQSALEKLDKLAARNVLSAQSEYARLLYEDPKMRNERDDKILSLLETACADARCDAETKRLYATCLENGVGTVPDMKKAFSVLEQLAAQKDPEAMTRLSVMLNDGIVCPRDTARSVELLKQAAESGYPAAWVQMGKTILLGEALLHDPAKALECFRTAADKMYPPAWRELGICYSAGIGVDKDDDAAFRFFDRSARSGDPEAMYLLGIAFRDGKGTTADLSGAFYWFNKAAVEGHPGAMRETAVALIEGKGVERNESVGRAWMRRAVEKGDYTAIQWARGNLGTNP